MRTFVSYSNHNIVAYINPYEHAKKLFGPTHFTILINENALCLRWKYQSLWRHFSKKMVLCCISLNPSFESYRVFFGRDFNDHDITINQSGSQCMGTWKADRKMVSWTPDLAQPYIGLGASWRCGSNPKHFWLRNSFKTHTISDSHCKLNINAIVFVPSHFKYPRIAFCLDSTDVNSNGLAPVLKRWFYWALTAQMLFTSLLK